MDRPVLAELLDLTPHPEGGWFRETWRSERTLDLPDYPGPRSAGTAIYYLLAPGEESAWHRVRSAELWFWHRGGAPADAASATLGPDCPQLLVPPGVWQSARPAGNDEVLVSCVVVPGFDFADFELG
ncbi:MAG: cupin domain-containing protein [Sporichthyaceae bacterium]